MKACPAAKGDFFEFFAEIDLLAALSTCPGGDLSIGCFGDHDPVECCRPISIEVKKVQPEILTAHSWVPPSPAYTLYKGCHGLKAKEWA